MIILSNIKMPLDYTEEQLLAEVRKRLRLTQNHACDWELIRRSLDARKREQPHFVMQVSVEGLPWEKWMEKDRNISQLKAEKRTGTTLSPGLLARFREQPPVVCGLGPAGLLVTYYLLEAGIHPIVVEQGEAVESRIQTVKQFIEVGQLNPDSNIQFGEGGAGTFSDGKLVSRIKDNLAGRVAQIFVKYGAPEEIAYDARPHIGTDRLRQVLIRMREDFLRRGADIRFQSKLESLKLEPLEPASNEFPSDEGFGRFRLTACQINDQWMPCHTLFLALGHSSRSTVETLHLLGVHLEAKPFAVGFRIEHPQEDINRNQYGSWAYHPRLKAADYRLTAQAGARGIFTFCMCPGGTVVPAASEVGGVVTNGMSLYARDGENANSALICQVSPEDFGTGVLDGIRFQREIEQKAFQVGGGDYGAPAQRLQDFLESWMSSDSLGLRQVPKPVLQAWKNSCQQSNWISPEPTYRPGVRMIDCTQLYPPEITRAIAQGLLQMGAQVPVWGNPRALLTGVETRSSSPYRITREKGSHQSINVSGLWPCGEGSGYAGGITSSAVDGYRAAEEWVQREGKSQV